MARSNRAFGDKKLAEEQLLKLGLYRDEIWKEKMISPNQAEELLMGKRKRPKKEIAGLLEDFTIKPLGPPTLVPVNDRREEITPDGDRFQDLDAVENPE